MGEKGRKTEKRGEGRGDYGRNEARKVVSGTMGINHRCVSIL